MLKKLLMIMMITMSFLQIIDIQANTNVFSHLPEAIQQRVYDRLNNPEDNAIIETKLAASDLASDAYFGNSIALDGTTLVVGAYRDNENGTNSGSVYVYDLTKQSNEDGFERKITASESTVDGQFGWSVAIEGRTLVVGANNTDGWRGSVYVYNLDLDNDDPDFERKITASDSQRDAYFGNSVAIDGTTLVVGAYLARGNTNYCGSVYVYDLTKDGNASTPSTPATPYEDEFERKIIASDGAASDRFGWSVAIEGTTVVVGSFLGDTDNGVNSGSVYVYDLNLEGKAAINNIPATPYTSGFERKITASDALGGDYFGQSVALDGTTLVVGAYNDDNENSSKSGSVYVYDLNLEGKAAINNIPATPYAANFERKITASDGAAGDNFGWSVVIEGDTLVVGAYNDDDDCDCNGNDSGSVYVYNLNLEGKAAINNIPATPYAANFERKITASDGAPRDQFGISIAINGTKLAVGAWYDDFDSGTDSGSVYIYNGSFGSGTTKTDEEWASEITTMIELLTEPYVRADVEAARDAYDALTPEQQALVTNYQTLLNAEQALADIDAAAAVDAMIDALTDPYDIEAIDAARDAYENLTETQKALVTGLSDLEEAEERYADIDAASIVDGMIAALSEPYDAVAVYDARLAYDALTETQKGYVTRLPELEAAEQALADINAAAAVDALIDALTSPYVRADVEAARDAYDNLTEAQQLLVTGLLDLEAAEAGLIDQAIAQAVELLINTLTTPYDSDAVQTARDAYDALTPAQQALVTNYQALLDAEQALTDIAAAVAVDAMIDAFTDPLVSDDVAAARDAYNNLTESQQALVTGLSDLLNAEQALEDIDAAAEVDALIDLLISPYDATDVKDAREAYDALTEAQQALVTGLTQLEIAEAELNDQLNAQAAAEVDALIQTLSEEATKEDVEAAREAYDALTPEQQALVTELPTLETYERQVEPSSIFGSLLIILIVIAGISAVIYFGFYKRDRKEKQPVAPVVAPSKVEKEDTVSKAFMKKKLLELRETLTKKYDYAEFFIYTDEQLDLLIEHQPKTKAEFIKVKGFGEKKHTSFGKDVI